MSISIRLLRTANRLVWLPLERLNNTRRAAEYSATKKAHTMAALRRIEAYNGKTSPDIIKRCDDYSRDVFGWKGYAPSLYVYSALAGEFKEGWIPGTYYDQVVVPVTSGDFGDLSEYKSLGGRLLESRRFPDVARLMQGVFYDEEFRVVPVRELKDKLFARSSKVVFKLDNSNKGRAVHVVTRDEFEPQRFLRLGNGCFQYFVDQHETLKALSPNAVATLRMTTAIDRNGVASVRACYLRVGRTTDPTIKPSSQIRIVVDCREGGFAPLAFLPDDRQIAAHPDSGIAFEGGAFPSYANCVEAVNELHRRVPYVSCIGWDVCVDSDDEPRILEWNGRHNAIGFGEAVQGPCFRDLGWEDLWRQSKGMQEPGSA
jgi:hypothetical protein